MELDAIAREVRYVSAATHSIFGSVSAAVVDELIRDFSAFSARSRPLLAGESGIVALVESKTAALLADRVWLLYAGNDDRLDFGFGLDSPMAIRIAALHALMHATGFMHATRNAVPPEESPRLSCEANEFIWTTERDLSREYSMRVHAAVVPLYGSALQRDTEYRPGNWAVIVAVVKNLAVVAEESLTWDQVIEFRRDFAARTAYRRFVHWLDKEMVGQSMDFVLAEIADRMEKYGWALRKHGLQTVVGALESTIDPRSVFGGAAAAFTVDSLGHQPLLSMLAGAGFLLGKAAVTAAAKLIERQDIIEGQREIAFVHELREKLGA